MLSRLEELANNAKKQSAFEIYGRIRYTNLLTSLSTMGQYEFVYDEEAAEAAIVVWFKEVDGEVATQVELDKEQFWKSVVMRHRKKGWEWKTHNGYAWCSVAGGVLVPEFLRNTMLDRVALDKNLGGS